MNDMYNPIEIELPWAHLVEVLQYLKGGVDGLRLVTYADNTKYALIERKDGQPRVISRSAAFPMKEYYIYNDKLKSREEVESAWERGDYFDFKWHRINRDSCDDGHYVIYYDNASRSLISTIINGSMVHAVKHSY